MAILKIRDDKGVITNIAAIRGENGKSPIIKNGTWWTYDNTVSDYVDTGVEAVKDKIVTKEAVESVLTGTITSHDHDDVYIKDAPSDSKQYIRSNGEWASIDFSSADFATKEELNTKVDKVEGKVLSTNDYTTEEKNKLAGITAGAEVNVNADWNATEGDALILNKPTIPSNVSELTNDNGYITKDVSNLTNYSTTDTVNQAINNAVSSKVDTSSISTVATSGDYNDLNNKPVIPSSTSELTNDSDYITSSEVDTKINSAVAAVYKVRGSVDNYESLPISNVTVGDVYNLLDTGSNYVCISIDPIIWDKLSETIDLSSYSTTEENDAKYQLKGNYITSIPDEYVTDTELEAKGYATATSVEAALATKLDSSVYTAYDILNKINTVDGEGSGLDADTLDGKDSTEFVLNSDINDLRLAIQVITPELKASLVNLESEDESLKTAAIDYIINLMPQNSMTIFVINNFAEEDIANYISNSITTEIIRANLGAENTDTIYIKYEFPTTFNAPSIYPIYNRQYSINISTKTLQKQISAFCYLDDELEYVVVDSERSLNKEVYIPTKNNLPTYLFSNINEVTTLTSMPIDKYNIKATVTEATTISFIGTPAEGMEYMIEVLNSSSSDITQPIPTDGTWQSDYSNIVLTAGRVTSISIKYIHGKYLVRV